MSSSREKNLFSGGSETRVEPTVHLLFPSTAAAAVAGDVTNVDASTVSDPNEVMDPSSAFSNKASVTTSTIVPPPSTNAATIAATTAAATNNGTIVTESTPPIGSNAVTISATATATISNNDNAAPSTRGPCSNDNPEWEQVTLPCAVIDNNLIFDGAIDATTSTTTTATIAATTDADAGTASSAGSNTDSTNNDEQTSNSDATSPSDADSSNVSTAPVDSDEVVTTSSKNDKGTSTTSPSFYSCSAASGDEINAATANNDNSNNNNNNKVKNIPLFLRYNYEIYTPPNANDEDITNVLAKFENDLTYGMASSLGLVDCSQQLNTNANIAEFANTEISLKQASFQGGRSLLTHNDSQTHDYHYARRSLRNIENAKKNKKKKRLLAKLDDDMIGTTVVAGINGGDATDGSTPNPFLGVSAEPVDMVDTVLLGCTSSPPTMDMPSKCIPIRGFMTAWITEAQQTRLLRHLATTTTEEEHEEMLLGIIESYIEQNQTSYLTNNDANSNANDQLLHVSYVGERTLSIGMINPDVLARPVPSGNKVVNLEDDNGGFKAGYIGIATAAVLLAFVAIGAVWVRRHRRPTNRQEATNEPQLESGDGLEDGEGYIVGASRLASPMSSSSQDNAPNNKSLFGMSRGDSEEEEGAFPTVVQSESTMANKSGSFDYSNPLVSPQLSLIDDDGDDPDESQLSSLSPPQDENVPSDNLFGLSPGDRSDTMYDETSPSDITVVASGGAGAFDTALILPSVPQLDDDLENDESNDSVGDDANDGGDNNAMLQESSHPIAEEEEKSDMNDVVEPSADIDVQAKSPSPIKTQEEIVVETVDSEEEETVDESAPSSQPRNVEDEDKDDSDDEKSQASPLQIV